ncbi:Translin-1 [Tilletia horrida]|uniref:Translin-1 n=1 Tax=Tilletia horrida TaxID=155126 RepID=A0AAN6JPN4_9BASI|nr:Translin-1 [Tilletia horrida]KAK0533721.1 Translin-1 [Tilletia horrida]KAK0540682.1 Translin-1 [Tilletia horrida]
MPALNIVSDFASLLQQLEDDRAVQDTIKENAKAVERAHRLLAAQLNRVHSAKADQIASVIAESASHFAECRQTISTLTASVPEQQYWKYNGIWGSSFSAIIGTSAIAYFLSTGLLLSKEESSQVLGLREETASRVFLTTEEYLHGLVNMINDLSRLAMNAVTVGDYASPLRMSSFVKEVHAGFQLLNLKNDSLRKRFDAIKYDVKRIEEVVYDLSLRKLLSAEDIASIDTSTPIAPPAGASSTEDARAKVLAIMTGRS